MCESRIVSPPPGLACPGVLALQPSTDSPSTPPGRRRVFRLLLLAIVVCAVVALGVCGELLLRWQQKRRIEARLAELRDSTRNKVTRLRSGLPCYRGRKEEAGLHFLTRRKIPTAYRPYIEHRRVPFANASVRLNGLAYRCGEIEIPKPEQTFRILLYGGSMVWGTGVLTDGETVSGRLEALLNETGDGATRYEVINCGETGFGSTQEAVYLLIEGVLLSPDLVLFIDGVNDAGCGYTDIPAGYPFMFQQISARMSTGRRLADEYTIDDELAYLQRRRDAVWSLESSLLVDQFLGLARRARDASASWRKESSTSADAYAIRHFYNLRAARGLGRAFGFSVAAAPQPIPLFFKPLHEQEALAIRFLRRKDSYFNRHAWWEDHYLEYTDRVLDLCRSAGVPAFDLRRVFKGNTEQLYVDDCHLCGEAHRLMAAALYEWMSATGLLTTAPGPAVAAPRSVAAAAAEIAPARIERLVRSNATYSEQPLKIVSRATNPDLPPSPAFGPGVRTYRPYIEYRQLSGQGGPSAINSLGYRGPEFLVTKPNGVFRVLVYGGSLAWGEGADDGTTLPVLLERMLNAAGGGRRVEVINCAEPGFNSTQSAIYLLIEGVYLQPDLVLFVDGAHEAGRAPSNIPAGYPFFFDRINALMTQGERFRSMFSLEDESEYLRKQRRLVAAFASMTDIDRLPEHTTIGEYAGRYGANMRAASGLAEEFGFRTCAVIQPVPFFHKRLTSEERAAIDTAREDPDRAGLVAWREQSYDALADRLVAACRAAGVAQLDLRRAFAEVEATVYLDDLHPNDDGRRRIAQLMADWLIAEELVPAERTKSPR